MLGHKFGTLDFAERQGFEAEKPWLENARAWVERGRERAERMAVALKDRFRRAAPVSHCSEV